MNKTYSFRRKTTVNSNRVDFGNSSSSSRNLAPPPVTASRATWRRQRRTDLQLASCRQEWCRYYVVLIVISSFDVDRTHIQCDVSQSVSHFTLLVHHTHAYKLVAVFRNQYNFYVYLKLVSLISSLAI